jgi:hypothetical protein
LRHLHPEPKLQILRKSLAGLYREEIRGLVCRRRVAQS